MTEGASPECRRGGHIGREDGGLLVLDCERCGGEFWRAERLHHALTDAAMLAVGGRYAGTSAVVDAALWEKRRPRPPVQPRRRAMAARSGRPGGPCDRAHHRRSCPRA